MTISYPISLPAAFAMARLTIRANNTVGESVSPFSAAQQVYEHPGQWWEADVQLPPMARADAEDVLAAFLSLRGKYGTFLLAAPNATARGAGGGTPVVDGASQTGHTLAVRGGPLSATDGTGDATLDIWPRLRSSPADGATVTIASCKGLFQLADNRVEYDIEPAMIYGYSFACRERL